MSAWAKPLLLCVMLWPCAAFAIDPCDRSGALFVASDVQERDVPKAAPIRVRFGASAIATFSCYLVTDNGAVLVWADDVGCAVGSPSLVVRWRQDGTVGAACDPIPEQPIEEEGASDEN